MASPQATENYFKRLRHKGLHADAIRMLGATSFRVAPIGFGGYRVHHNSVEHARALRYGLLNGFNLIDTSSNYTDGGSEILIGNLMHEMLHREEIGRDEVVIVSKVGYVQGQNLALAQQQEAAGQPFAKMVKYMDGCWHCIHPDFLQDQLNRSLDRLRLPSLDVYLLHNPEYFLSDARKRDVPMDEARETYYQRIKRAFEWLEEKVAEGKIQAYGISSNTFPSPADDYEFTSLERVTDVAHSVSSNPYFRVIQFPLNLYESGAVFEKNQIDQTRTLLEVAREHRLGTLVNRPLNAMVQGSMVRLASFRQTDEKTIQKDFDAQLKKLAELEAEFKRTHMAKAPEEVPQQNLEVIFSLSKQLDQGLGAFPSWSHWDHARQNVILPQVTTYLGYLNQHVGDDAAWSAWSQKYAETLLAFLDTISKRYENQAQERSERIARRLDELDPALESCDTLSQRALRVLTSTEGIDCVLLGMRRTPYVEDALTVLKQPRLNTSYKILKAFKHDVVV